MGVVNITIQHYTYRYVIVTQKYWQGKLPYKWVKRQQNQSHFCFVLANAIPRHQEPTITHSICPQDDIYNECYSLDFPGSNDDDVILLKETGPQGFGTGRLQSRPDSEVISIWNDNVGLNVTVCKLITRLDMRHFC